MESNDQKELKKLLRKSGYSNSVLEEIIKLYSSEP